jgi:hypothetical protein
MSGLPATSNQPIAAISQGSANFSGSSSGWTSTAASLMVQTNQLILVRASFTASSSGGFAWSILSSGPVTEVVGSTDVFNPVTTPDQPLPPYATVSRTALYTATDFNTASFAVFVSPPVGSLGGDASISNLVLIARVISAGGQS